MTDTALPTISRKRRYAFYVLTGLFSLLAITIFFFLSPLKYPPWVIIGWFSPRPPDLHQLHNMMGGAANWVYLTAIVLQFHKPEQKVAGLQMMFLWMIGGQIIGSFIPGGFVPFSLIPPLFLGGIALLHPARREMLRIGRPNPELLALFGLAALPLLIYTVNQMNLQLTASDQHAEWFHYVSIADQAFFMLVASLLAGFKTPGWLIPACSAGFMVIVLGLASIVYPAQASSVGILWGSLAVLWGLVFVGVAVWKRRQAPQV